jgi:peptidyl-prolyl cis-trans isomerase SurA
MKQGIICTAIIMVFFHLLAFSQFDEKDPVLFFVEDDTVRVSEFKYIYEKNNRDSLRHSRESIADYLQLYIKFKLKVQAAKDMGLDTVKALQDELAMYRRQLAKNYLIDKEVEEAIARKAYERMQEDIHLSHILIRLEKNEDSTKAYQEAKRILDSLKNYEKSFEQMAKRHSDDPSVKKNEGDLGYLTALFPPGFEQFEAVAYQMEEGEIAGPVRSKAGYHIVKLHDRRPARGTVEVAHILVRKPDEMNDSQIALKKDKIYDAYRELQEGIPWNRVVSKYSEDKDSKRRKGNIGEFRIGVYEKPLEDTAFALEENGAYSMPVESSVGWHILKRVDRERPQDQSFPDLKKEILAQLEKTNRLDKAKQALIDEIKEKADFNLNQKVFSEFKSKYLEDFTNYKWESPSIDTPEVLIAFGDDFKKTDHDFVQYLKRNTRDRLRLNRKVSDLEAANIMLDAFIDESALEYEQAFLEEKYPDFRNLMREYREGILLFEVTKDKIWDRAPTDSAGLRAYYEDHKEDYMWNERVRVLSFTVHTDDQKQLNTIKRMLKKKSVSKVIEKFNTDTLLIRYKTEILEKGKDVVADVPWTERAIFNEQELVGKHKFDFVQNIFPREPKTLQEARGFVISDYQSHLEKEWIKSLQEKYKVKVVEAVFDELVESYQ